MRELLFWLPVTGALLAAVLAFLAYRFGRKQQKDIDDAQAEAEAKHMSETVGGQTEDWRRSVL